MASEKKIEDVTAQDAREMSREELIAYVAEAASRVNEAYEASERILEPVRGMSDALFVARTRLAETGQFAG